MPVLLLQNLASLFEFQTRCAWIDFRVISVTKITHEIGFPFAVGKKFSIDLALIESRHRSAIQTNGSGRDNEIRSRQAAIPESRVVDQWLIADKPRAGIDGRIEFWQLFVKLCVIGNDGNDRRSAGFFYIGGGECRIKSRFRF